MCVDEMFKITKVGCDATNPKTLYCSVTVLCLRPMEGDYSIFVPESEQFGSIVVTVDKDQARRKIVSISVPIKSFSTKFAQSEIEFQLLKDQESRFLGQSFLGSSIIVVDSYKLNNTVNMYFPVYSSLRDENGDEMPTQKVLLIGPRNVGKTTLLNSYKSMLSADLEVKRTHLVGLKHAIHTTRQVHTFELKIRNSLKAQTTSISLIDIPGFDVGSGLNTQVYWTDDLFRALLRGFEPLFDVVFANGTANTKELQRFLNECDAKWKTLSCEQQYDKSVRAVIYVIRPSSLLSSDTIEQLKQIRSNIPHDVPIMISVSATSLKPAVKTILKATFNAVPHVYTDVYLGNDNQRTLVKDRSIAYNFEKLRNLVIDSYSTHKQHSLTRCQSSKHPDK